MDEDEEDDNDEDIVEFCGVLEWKTVVREYCDVRIVVGILVFADG
jgi:hypothetical protein